MRILLVGAGVMSEYLLKSIKEHNYECIGRVDFMGNGDYLNFESVNDDFDVIIDFSHHSVTKNLLDFAVKKGKNVLIATTGHTDEEMEMILRAKDSIGIIKATNTSFGVTALNSIVEYATKILKGFDIEIVEKHHNRKIDAPSGTAKTLANVIKEASDENLEIVTNREGKREKNEIGIHSVRAGSIVGEHSVIFSKGDEILEISHNALSRKIFADGAIDIAEKLVKLSNGIYSMKDVI